jgi:1,4-alpha-glucan branching enzyme
MLQKKSSKKGKIIKVTFYTHKTPNAETAFVVGDFNGWDETSHPMSQLKDERFKVVLELEPGNEYQFRYLVDGEWHNDWDADKYTPNPFSGDNSIVIT